MPPDLEPASALTSVENAEDFAVRVAASYTTWHNAGALVAARDAAVREPLERRIASLEAQLASAHRWIPVEERLPYEHDGHVLALEVGGDVPMRCVYIDGAWLNVDNGTYYDVAYWMPPLPPPAAQKEPSRAEPARRCVYDGTPLEPGDTVCGACCCVQPAQKEG